MKDNNLLYSVIFKYHKYQNNININNHGNDNMMKNTYIFF